MAPPHSDAPRADSIPLSVDDPLLSVASKRWIEGHDGKDWNHERADLARTVMADFIQIAGDLPISSYQKRHGREFSDVYQRLPANAEKLAGKLQVSRGRDLKEIAEAAERDGRAAQHHKTANKKILLIDACFRWLMNEYDTCKTNPLEGIRVVGAGDRSANQEKDPFSPEQLNAIFASSVFSGCKSEAEWMRPGEVILRQSEKFWMPLLALYTGARSNELCQLTVANISETDGV